MQESSKEDQVNMEELWLKISAEELFENAPCGYLLAAPSGVIMKVSQSFLKLTGYAREDVVGKMKFPQLLTIGGKMFYETHHAPLVKMQGFVKELNYDMVCSNGSRLSVLINDFQRLDESGKPLFHLFSVLNYSDRKKYEDELRLAKKKAEAATEAKSLFLSTVTHEIRTPLHAIMGVSDLILNANPRSDQLELLQTLRFSAHNLLQLVNGILDLSKMEAGRMELKETPFDVYQMAANLINSLRPNAHQKGLQLDLLITEQLPRFLMGDELNISRVLLNLLSNAIKFTDTGRIFLKIEIIGKSDEEVILQFLVVDTGIGIPTNKLEAIFEAFEQANDSVRNNFGGTGLGLTISKKLLELHGAQLKVKSEENNGATFYFELKLKVLDAAIPTINRSREMAPLRHIKLLLVDDNKSNQLIASRYFQLWSINFDIAQNGMEAVAMVKAHDYDLVLMDLEMPIMNGYEAAEHIRSEKPGQPIVALTAAMFSEISQKMKNAGIEGFINKPFDPIILHEAIVKHSGKKILVSQGTSEDHPPSQTSPTPAQNSHIEVQQIQAIFEGDPTGLVHYRDALVNDLTDISQALNNALTNLDAKSYHSAAHQALSFVQLFEAKTLGELIEQGTLALKAPDEKEVASLKDRLVGEMNHAISILRLL